MNEFAILHLSDLHIDSKGRSYSKLLGSLLNDIKRQIVAIPDNRLVVVITGDIINIGDYEAISNAKKFFQKLKEITENKIRAIYVVPGNHDQKRTKTNSFLIPAYRQVFNGTTRKQFDGDFKDNIWPIQKKAYSDSGYLELMKYIYDELFHMPEIGAIVYDTYGVHVLEIERRKYCFILINTAWSCVDQYDTRNLILGKFQLDDISSAFHDLTDEEELELTFIMGHHPIECLHGTEQDALFSYMISYNEISANAYLCGHTHDRNIINWSNNRHAIHTFMTGFGWPEEPSDRVHDHYYSIYMFNMHLNSVDIYVRKTNDGSDFIPDLSIYTGNSRQENDKLVRPIRFQEAQGTIILSTAENMPIKTTYASVEFLNYSKQFLSKMHEISLDICGIIDADKNDLYENLILSGAYSEEERAEIKDALLKLMNAPETVESLTDQQRERLETVIKQNGQRVFDNFQSYIQRLCQKLREELVPPVNTGQIIRFHFRYLSDKSTGTYSTLCSSFSPSDESEDWDSNQPTDIKFEDLLEATFKASSTGCLIYSMNRDVCTNKLRDKWENYITVIPKFERNVYTKRVNQKASRRYPYITFGVTINDSAYDKILYCMDFYSIDQFISGLLQKYLSVFLIDVDTFLKWIKREDRMEEK